MNRSVGRSIASGGALSLVRLATGVVRVKVLALALGVEGVGIYAILLQLQLTGVAAVSMSLAVPIIILGRPKLAAGAMEGAGQVVGTALAVLIVNAGVLLLLAFFYGQDLLTQIGANPAGHRFVWPIALAIVVGALSNTLGEGMAFLTDRFGAYVKVGMIGSVADMLLVATGAALFGIQGAVIGMAIGVMVLFTAYATLVGRAPAARDVFRNLSARIALLPQLFTYSVMMFLAVAMTNVGLTFLRSVVLTRSGAAENGHLQAVTALSAYMLAFVMTGFWGHLYSHAAAEGDTPAVRQELNRTLRLGLLISFTGCGTAAVLADFLIPLFYSNGFRAAAPMMTTYMPGELCFQLFSMLVAYQLTVSRRRVYLALSLGYIGLLVGVGLLLIPKLGGFGYVAAHNVASFVMLATALLLALRSGQLPRQLAIYAAGLVAMLSIVCAGTFFARSANQLPPAGVALGMLPFIFSGTILLRRLIADNDLAKKIFRSGN